MTKERATELKEQYMKEVIYYENLGFNVLRDKFQGVVNFLAEIEEEQRQQENVQEQIDLSQFNDQAAIKLGCILQSYGEEEKRK